MTKICKSWKKILKENKYKEIIKKLPTNYIPKRSQIFKCFKYFELTDTRVVILGQDPYPNVENAMGLSFSTNGKIPPSLKNIFNELYDDLKIENKNGDLTNWAKQNILLMNTSLTTIPGSSNVHSLLWKDLTDNIIKEISKQTSKVVFILMGNYAKEKVKLIDTTKHYIIQTSHPSPMCSIPFKGCKIFSKTNKYLEDNKFKNINWKV